MSSEHKWHETLATFHLSGGNPGNHIKTTPDGRLSLDGPRPSNLRVLASIRHDHGWINWADMRKWAVKWLVSMASMQENPPMSEKALGMLRGSNRKHANDTGGDFRLLAETIMNVSAYAAEPLPINWAEQIAFWELYQGIIPAELLAEAESLRRQNAERRNKVENE